MKKLQINSIFLPLLFLSFGFSNCAGSRTTPSEKMFEQNPPFTIETAYFQKWVAGIKEGGSGIDIHIVFATIKSNVVVQDIYFRNQILKMQNSLNNSNKYVAHLSNNSRNDIVMDIDPMKEAQNRPSKKFPFEINENDAVISFLSEGKTGYFKISNLSEKEQIAYPQSNPNDQN